MIHFEKLWESLIEASTELPDWILNGIEQYLQAAAAGDIEGEVFADDVLDFIASTNVDKEFTDELQAAAKVEIEGYLPMDNVLEPAEEEDIDDDPYDEWVDPEAPQVDSSRNYPDAKDIDIVPDGVNTFTLVDTTSGEVLFKPMSKEDAEQKLHHIVIG